MFGQNESDQLVRFSVAMPESLLMNFDEFVARRGVAKNRSEVVRDLVRDVLVRSRAEEVGAEVVGTLTIVFNHHASEVQETLHAVQHSYLGIVVSSMHVHLDEENCLEVIILRGETTDVHLVADRLAGTKGVKHSGLVVTTAEQMV